MIRLATIRFVDGGREVPVAINRRDEVFAVGWSVERSSEGVVRWKYSSGTLPHVRGPMNDAIADWPGCR